MTYLISLLVYVLLPSGGRNMTFNPLIRLVRRDVETMISRNLTQNLAICLAPFEGGDCLWRRKKKWVDCLKSHQFNTLGDFEIVSQRL